MAEDEPARGRARYEVPRVLRLEVLDPARAACAVGGGFDANMCADGIGAKDACYVGASVGSPSVCVPGSDA